MTFDLKAQRVDLFSGGGWTLVASISAQNNDHLQRAEHNCFDSELCVPFANASISGRKFSDEDIHEIAVNEGESSRGWCFVVARFTWELQVNQTSMVIPSTLWALFALRNGADLLECFRSL